MHTEDPDNLDVTRIFVHELRNTLLPIRTVTRRRVLDDRSAALVQDAVNLVETLARGLRTYCQAGSGSTAPHTGARVAGILERLLATYRNGFPDVRVKTSCPAAPDCVPAEGFEAAVAAVLENAFLAADPGGTVDVVVDEVRHGVVRVRIEDTGGGVAAHLTDCLFDPFTGDRRGAAGMGLATARRLAHRAGAAVRLVCAGGKATPTAFELEWPCCASVEIPNGATSPPSREMSG